MVRGQLSVAAPGMPRFLPWLLVHARLGRRNLRWMANASEIQPPPKNLSDCLADCDIHGAEDEPARGGALSVVVLTTGGTIASARGGGDRVAPTNRGRALALPHPDPAPAARSKRDIAYCPAFISSKRCAMCATDRGAMIRSSCVHLRNLHSHWRKRNPLSKCPLRCQDRVSSGCQPFGWQRYSAE
jgi:hypothetical protein